MSSTIFLSIASMCFIIITIIVYFTKERVDTSENEIFSRLLFVSFLALFSEIYITIIPADINSLIFRGALKVYLMFCILWTSYFMEYVFIITRNNKKKELVNFKKKYRLVYSVFWALVNIAELCVILLPIYFYDQNGMKYSYGPSVNIVFALSGIYTLIMMFYIIKNYKYLKNKDYLPIIVLVLLLLATVIIQKINPSLLIANTCFALITTLMYNTIENPDIRMIKELNYSKRIAENRRNKTLVTLDSIFIKLKNTLNNLVTFGYKKIDKNNKDEVLQELDYIQKYSIRVADEISGIIELEKINSGDLELKEQKYETYDMLNDIKELLLLEKSNNKINVTTDISNDIKSILYGDSDKIKQVVIYLFRYIASVVKTGTINIKVDEIQVGRFDRLRFSFILENNILNSMTRKNEEKGNIIFDGDNNTDYLIASNLLKLINGKLEFNSANGKANELILSIDQRLISQYEVLEQEEQNKNIKVKYFDLSSKNILIVDDNRMKLKEIMLLLKPYKININIASNLEDLKQFLWSDKTYDLVLIDDIIPNFGEVDIVNVHKEVQKFAKYNLKTIIMVTKNEDYEKYLKNGFSDYILKPINKKNINLILEKNLKEIKNSDKV